MTPAEFFDKENGTTRALAVPLYTDDQLNQLRELAHEACETCELCEEHLCADASPFSLHPFRFYLDEDREHPVHEECYADAHEAHLERQAEDRADRRAGQGYYGLRP